MIFWLDFILDNEIGPLLNMSAKDQQSRRTRFGNLSIMEDAAGNADVHEHVLGMLIRETGQEQQPARMAGLSSLDSIAESGMEASLSNRTLMLRKREEE